MRDYKIIIVGALRREEITEAELVDCGAPALQDIVKRLPAVKTKGKIKSSSLILGKGTQLRVNMALLFLSSVVEEPRLDNYEI